jgi:glycosyltransferase involved in cell wall biosynthesis
MTPTAASPFFTIVTVVYNERAKLEQTIQSVVTQDFADREYLIVDGGSTDGSAELIRRHEPSLAAWVSEADNGIYHAMNKGIALASGQWVCFLNAGDVFTHPDTLSRVAREMRQLRQSTDVVYGNILVRRPDNRLTERVAKEPCNLHRMYFCHQSAFVRLPVLKAYGFDEGHQMSADLKFFKQCYYDKKRFVHLPFPLVVYDTSGISHTQRERGLRDNIAVVRSLDTGWRKHLFLLRLHFTLYWRKFFA